MQRRPNIWWLQWLAFALIVVQASSPVKEHSRESSLLLTPVYSDPWVTQGNVALTYANSVLTDGLGAQAYRLLGLQAIACALGLQYVHTPLLKVAHTPHMLDRWNRILTVPFASALVDDNDDGKGGWKVVDVKSLPTAKALEDLVSAAVATKQRTLIRACFVHELADLHPEVFHCLPRCRPMPWGCSETAVRSVRIAVHIRRGDITKRARLMRRRSLPPSYFINVVRNITQALAALGRDVVTEIFTEAQVFFPPGSPADEHHMPTEQLYKLLHETLNNTVILADEDAPWTLSQMASADVLVQSVSSFSAVAGLLNQRGIVVAPPQRHALHVPTWIVPMDVRGGLDADGYKLLQEGLSLRYASPPGCGKQDGGGTRQTAGGQQQN